MATTLERPQTDNELPPRTLRFSSLEALRLNTNPFSTTSIIPNEQGVFGKAKRLRGGFLYRVIEIESPIACRLVYDGWWFRQKVVLSGHVAWLRISWLTIHRIVEFRIPPEVAPGQPEGRIEIEFGRGLGIRRFRVWLAGEIAYDEIN